MGVGERIRELRKAFGYTQKELAEKSGVATVSIQQYERGVRQPRIEQLNKISAVFQVPLSHFVDVEPVNIEIISEDELTETRKRQDDQYISLIEYLKTIGYKLYFEIADGGSELYYALQDTEKGKVYILSEDEVSDFADNVLMFTKFSLQEILKNKVPLDNTIAPQPPPDPQEGTDTTQGSGGFR